MRVPASVYGLRSVGISLTTRVGGRRGLGGLGGGGVDVEKGKKTGREREIGRETWRFEKAC